MGIAACETVAAILLLEGPLGNADVGLQPGEVPHVALVDPNDHCVVYFLQGSKLFSLDVRKKQVIACKESLIDRDQVILFQSSRPVVDAWELPPPPPTFSGDDDDLLPEGKRVHPNYCHHGTYGYS